MCTKMWVCIIRGKIWCISEKINNNVSSKKKTVSSWLYAQAIEIIASTQYVCISCLWELPSTEESYLSKVKNYFLGQTALHDELMWAVGEMGWRYKILASSAQIAIQCQCLPCCSWNPCPRCLPLFSLASFSSARGADDENIP